MKALLKSKRKEGDADMMDYISLAGFFLAVFVAGVSVGRFTWKVERLVRKLDDEEYRSAHKNDRR